MKLRLQIFLIAFALGILPLLTLVAVNLSGHIKRHEEVWQQQADTRLKLELANLNQEISHYRQSLAVMSRLPEVRKLVASDRPGLPSTELASLVNHWLTPLAPVEELIICDQNDRQKISFLRSNNVFIPQIPESREKIPHNRFSGAGEFFLSTTVQDGGRRMTTSFRINTELFLPAYLDAFWVSPLGEYLRQPYKIKLTVSPDTNAFEDFPQLQPLLSFRKAALWDSRTGYTVAWMPVLLDGLRPSLWVGSLVDRTAAGKWKRSLVQNIVTIILIMSALVFLVANTIAKKIDSIKEQILTGLDQVLNKDREFRFKWSGPREITAMAEDLSRLAQKYVKTSRARHEAESALRENQENFRNLTNSAQDAIVLMDHNGNISYWNQTAEEMFGYRRHEALGKPIHSLIAPQLMKDDRREPVSMRSEKDGPIRETIELVTRKRNGTELPVELSLSEARIRDQWHSIWIIRDISERKWAEEKSLLHHKQLLQADKMVSLGLLVSGVAHEINNPNSIALLNIPMLAKSWQSVRPILDRFYDENGDFLVAGLDYSEMRDQVPRLFQELDESARRIKDIVKDLKDYARQDNTRAMQLVDLNEVVRASARLTGNLIKNSTARFMARYDEKLPPIRGNSQRLEQVMINLLQNSCDALESNQAAIVVETGISADGGRVHVRVEDEGCGIPTESLNQVTDPFFTTKRGKGGTGLGLSVSAGIVKEHGGTMEFQSSDRGTTVTITFPVSETVTGDTPERPE